MALLAWAFKTVIPERGATLCIAAVGPFGVGNIQGEKMRQGIELAVAEVNGNGGINGKAVKVRFFSDGNRAERAVGIARRIADEKEALVVLGHFLSSTSIAAGDLYRGKIPAITASATAGKVTQGNDWYFSSVFNNTFQAQFIAYYIHAVVKQNSVYIIHDSDAFGRSLAAVAEKKFRELGGEVSGIWPYAQSPASGREVIHEIVSEMQVRYRSDGPGAVFLALHREQAAKAIGLMRRKGMMLPVIGPDSLGDRALVHTLEDAFPEEATNPGHFSNGIYATSHVIFDIAGAKAQHFMEAFAEKFKNDNGCGAPTWESAVYYDATMLALDAMRTAGATGDIDRIDEERKQVRDCLAEVNSPDHAMKGVCGDIFFQKEGDANQPVHIGKFENQKFISAMVQLYPVLGTNGSSNLSERLAGGRTVIVDERYMNKTQVVYTGIDVLDITDFDLVNATYCLDFYIWFRHRVPTGSKGARAIPVENIEFINAAEKISLGAPIFDETMNGISWKAYRVKAKFKGEFRFEDYPFDQQGVTLRFYHRTLTRDDLIYVVDVQGMRKTAVQEYLQRRDPDNVRGWLNNWMARAPVFYQDTVENVSTLGNPAAFNTDTRIAYSRFNMDIEMKRNSICFTLKKLFPLFVILLLTYVVFYLSPGDFSKSNTVGGGALLTAAFFHMQLSKNLPKIDYLVVLDYIFYAAYSLILFEVILITSSNRANGKNDIRRIRALSRIGKFVIPVVVIGGMIFLGLKYDISPAKKGEIVTGKRAENTRGVKVGFVTGPGGLGDHSYNDLVYQGLKAAEKELGIQGQIAVPRSGENGAAEEMMEALIHDRCHVIIAVGSHGASAVNRLAVRFSPVKFVIVGGLGTPRDNVTSITYRQHEGAFFIGVLSAMVPGASRLGVLGATKSAFVESVGVAYEEGARLINPEIEIIRDYVDTHGALSGVSGSRTSYEIAKGMYGRGAALVFAVCGESGDGTKKAADELGRQAMGVDFGEGRADAGRILTTMPRCIERGVSDTIRKIMNRESFSGHIDYGLKDNDIPMKDIQLTRLIDCETKIRKADMIKRGIVSGEIRVPVYPHHASVDGPDA